VKSRYLSSVIGLLAPFQAVLSVYVMLRGHNAPGGGFIGGLLLGSTLVLLTFIDRVSAERMRTWTQALIAGGTLVILGSVVFSMVLGLAPLTGVWGSALVGGFRPSNILAFDLGVYLTVAGFLGLFALMGREAAR
jgi:multicomponent Na+:H+ antiporter subunit B